MFLGNLIKVACRCLNFDTKTLHSSDYIVTELASSVYLKWSWVVLARWKFTLALDIVSAFPFTVFSFSELALSKPTVTLAQYTKAANRFGANIYTHGCDLHLNTVCIFAVRLSLGLTQSLSVSIHAPYRAKLFLDVNWKLSTNLSLVI